MDSRCPIQSFKSPEGSRSALSYRVDGSADKPLVVYLHGMFADSKTWCLPDAPSAVQ